MVHAQWGETLSFKNITQNADLSFRYSGAPAKIERFFITLADMEIPCKADRAWGTFTIAGTDFAMMKSLAAVLSLTISTVE